MFANQTVLVDISIHIYISNFQYYIHTHDI